MPEPNDSHQSERRQSEAIQSDGARGDMTPAEFRAAGHAVVDWIARYMERIGEYPVLSQATSGDLRASLPKSPPMDGEPLEAVLRDLDALIMPGITHWQRPRFFGYFPANTSGPAILGELLSAGLGVQGMMWSTSPACTELETHVLDWMVKALGLPSKFLSTAGSLGGGVIQDTASSATLCALLAAREQATGLQSNEKGMAGAAARLTAYTSTQAHSSIEKAVKIAGLGRENLRLIDVDANQQMRVDLLEQALASDIRDGFTPCFVCATVGTTGCGAIDPVREIAGVMERVAVIPMGAHGRHRLKDAGGNSGSGDSPSPTAKGKYSFEGYEEKMRRENPELAARNDRAMRAMLKALSPKQPGGIFKRGWLHVDAAWAGSAAVCEEFRSIHDGVELADSFTFNPHKWLLTNFDCNCFYMADRAALVRALSILPEYLRNQATESGAVIDYRDWQIPLGRRFRALKLWIVLRHFGVRGLQAHIRRHVALANEFADWVRADPRMELAAPPVLGLVCFRLREGGDEATQRVLDAVNRNGRVFLTHCKLDGRLAIRMAIGATRTQREDVAEAWREICTATDSIVR